MVLILQFGGFDLLQLLGQGRHDERIDRRQMRRSNRQRKVRWASSRGDAEDFSAEAINFFEQQRLLAYR